MAEEVTWSHITPQNRRDEMKLIEEELRAGRGEHYDEIGERGSSKVKRKRQKLRSNGPRSLISIVEACHYNHIVVSFELCEKF